MISQNAMKGVFIKTYGCQMNVYDSARMLDILKPLGYLAVDAQDDADLLILNTCHIREKAAEKVYSELGSIRRLKAAKARRGDHMIVAIGGGVLPAQGFEGLRPAPVFAPLFGPHGHPPLPELISLA